MNEFLTTPPEEETEENPTEEEPEEKGIYEGTEYETRARAIIDHVLGGEDEDENTSE